MTTNGEPSQRAPSFGRTLPRATLLAVATGVATLAGCTWQGTRYVEKPVLEPVGQRRSVVVRDQHDSEALLRLPAGALNSIMWPTRVTDDAACFGFQLRLWKGAGHRSMRLTAWSWSMEVDGDTRAPVRGATTWAERQGPYGWEVDGEVCFPGGGTRAADVVSVHADADGPLELVFRWESSGEEVQ